MFEILLDREDVDDVLDLLEVVVDVEVADVETVLVDVLDGKGMVVLRILSFDAT